MQMRTKIEMLFFPATGPYEGRTIPIPGLARGGRKRTVQEGVGCYMVGQTIKAVTGMMKFLFHQDGIVRRDVEFEDEQCSSCFVQHDYLPYIDHIQHSLGISPICIIKH